jgi:K+/H+ antiporter YhaU regulatory subunit KhtT
MNGREVHIREQELTGIGRRFDLDLEEGQTLMVVALRDGSRDIAVRERGDDQVLGSVRLDREQAVAVGSLLLGARFSEDAGAAPSRPGMDVSIGRRGAG